LGQKDKMNPLLTMSPYKEYFSYLNTRKAHATPTTVEGYASDYRKFHELMAFIYTKPKKLTYLNILS